MNWKVLQFAKRWAREKCVERLEANIKRIILDSLCTYQTQDTDDANVTENDILMWDDEVFVCIKAWIG